MRYGKYDKIESAIIEALESGPKDTDEICRIVHDRLPAGTLSPDMKKEASTNSLVWRHEVRAAIEDLHLDKKMVRLDRQSHIYRLRVDKLEAQSQIEDNQTKRAASSQGYLQDSRKKKLIEEHAMKAAEEYFGSELKYKVNRHKGGQKYDLTCTKGGEKIFAEVKGTTSHGGHVLLTAGEVGYARRNPGRMALFVLHSIEVQADKASGGKEIRKLPWIVEANKLRPTHYLLELG